MTLRTGRAISKRSQSRDDRNGVTLIELILVMAILALVAVIAVPRFSGFMSGRKYQEEWNRLRGILRYARTEAISRSVPVAIQFNQEQGVYGLPGGYAQSPVPEGSGEHSLPEGLEFRFPENADLKDGKIMVTFTPDGSVDEESPKEIQLVERDGEFVRTLAQDPVWGYSLPTGNDAERIDDNVRLKTK